MWVKPFIKGLNFLGRYVPESLPALSLGGGYTYLDATLRKKILRRAIKKGISLNIPLNISLTGMPLTPLAS